MLDQPSIPFILLAFVLALGPLIFFHELGHYWMARWFGVGADAFSIGFGREVAGWTDKRGTRWKLGWLPLGGYVKLAGDMDPTSRPDPEDADPTHFQNQALYKRALIVAAGPAANFILAILIFAAFFMTIGMSVTPTDVERVEENSAAAEMGIEPGDRILAIDGREIENFVEIRQHVFIRPRQDITLTVERDGETFEAEGVLKASELEDEFGQKQEVGLLGIYSVPPRAARLAPWEAVPAGAVATWSLIDMIVEGLKQIITGQRSVKELGGPMKIAQVSGQQASLGIFPFIQLLAFLSINLGFINLLPVPMLDGGHLAFYSYEAVRRKPAGPRAQEWAYRIGLSLILALILFTTVNDLASFGVGERLQRLIG